MKCWAIIGKLGRRCHRIATWGGILCEQCHREVAVVVRERAC
jgi:hypothetical protein